MRLAMLLSVPFAALALMGCDSCSKTSEPPTAPSVASATPPPSSVPAPSASVGASGKMAHCPNAVQGAKTDIADVPGGVQLTVTGTDPAVVTDIRARTKALLDAQKNQGANVHHTGTGEGGGLLGRCPIVLKDTTVVTADVDNGTKVTLTAKDPAELDWLRRETRDREEDLAAAGAPAGAGKMSHCPSAVEGAMTTLKNTPDGVRVVVTAKEDGAVKAIRERSAHLAEVANGPADAGAQGATNPAIASHTGEGGGGGGIGRCPVVVKDTTLKVKDVTGGSEIDVKAKSAASVPRLQKEVSERAEKFQLPGAASAAGSASAAPAPSASH